MKEGKGYLDSLKVPGAAICIILLIWIIVYFFPFRWDLTAEKRYSLHPSSVAVLEKLEEPIEVEILLTGNLPGGMRRLQRSVEETIRTFNAYSRSKISYAYLDPLTLPADIREDFIVGLTEYGIQPTNLFVTEDGGQKSQMIFPGVLFRSEDYETGALILKGERGMSPDQILNQSVENLEFELINAIRKLIQTEQNSIGILMGHGELEEDEGFGIVEGLIDDHEVYKIPIEQARNPEDLDPFEVLIVAGPKEKYGEREVYLLDQYLMKGGKLVILMDAVAFDLQEAGGSGTVAMPFDSGLDQLLFRYGIRINKDLMQDLNFGYHPVMAGNFGDQEQMVPLPWPFYVAAGRMASHPITKGLDQVMFRYVSSIDTVKADGVIKTPLIFGSDFMKKIAAPVRMAFEDVADGPDIDNYTERQLPLLYLLQGRFTSLFKNRFLPEGMDKTNFLEEGQEGMVLVAGSGNLFKSTPNLRTGEPLPLGLDPVRGVEYANRLLLQNSIRYLLDPQGIIASRTKQFQLRPLNKVKVREERSKWQIINILIPVLITGLIGLVWVGLRKRRFGIRD